MPGRRRSCASMQGFAAAREQGERVFQAHEVSVAQVKAVAAAFIRMRVVAPGVDPLLYEPLAELPDFQVNERFGRQIGLAALVESAPRRVRRGGRFHERSMHPRALGVCAPSNTCAVTGFWRVVQPEVLAALRLPHPESEQQPRRALRRTRWRVRGRKRPKNAHSGSMYSSNL